MQVSKHIQQKGFTLLETLVAVFILTLALTGPIYIATLAIRSSIESRDNISAYYLAEEAIEVVRNQRDEKSLLATEDDATSWTYGIIGSTNCINAAGASTITSCYLTRDNDGVYLFTECDSAGCPPLAFNPAGSVIYGGDGSINSKFTREIYLQVASQDGSVNAEPIREVDLVVNIKWPDRGFERVFQIVERLHDQQYAKYYMEIE
jgi:prepilin-type N-terminal cleavage/methylation domain-containing protein